MATNWKIVDENGDVVMTAERVSVAATLERKTPRAIAQREARNLVNVEAGDKPVYAVPSMTNKETSFQCGAYDGRNWVDENPGKKYGKLVREWLAAKADNSGFDARMYVKGHAIGVRRQRAHNNAQSKS